jgi:hypothetical protein
MPPISDGFGVFVDNSTAEQTLIHAPCPLVVTRPEAARGRADRDNPGVPILSVETGVAGRTPASTTKPL